MIRPAFVLAILAGVALALPYLQLARRPRRSRIALFAGLPAAAVIYVVFAAVAGSWRDVLLELGGVLLFTAVAAAGLRWSMSLLALGWIGHVAWDLFLHPVDVSAYAPWWYPVVCIGFDVLVAGFILGAFPIRPAGQRLS
jgi:hypothetical protein